MIEISVKVSGDDQTLTQKYLLHEEGISLSHDDATLTKMVQDTIANFKGQPEDVIVKIKYTW